MTARYGEHPPLTLGEEEHEVWVLEEDELGLFYDEEYGVGLDSEDGNGTWMRQEDLECPEGISEKDLAENLVNFQNAQQAKLEVKEASGFFAPRGVDMKGRSLTSGKAGKNHKGKVDKGRDKGST